MVGGSLGCNMGAEDKPMKSLVLILSLAVVVTVTGCHYIDRTIDLMVARAQIVRSTPPRTPRAYSELTVPNSVDANSASDAIQTVYGMGLYQNARVRIQW